MTQYRRQAFTLALIGAAAFMSMAQSRPLNPTVQLATQPRGAAPAECEEGISSTSAAPRVAIADSEPLLDRVASDLAPPPRADLRNRLRATQTALDANDREGFRAAHNDAKAIVAGYPAGGERDAASNVIRVYDDIERLWQYQFDTPTGAFYAEDSELFRMAVAYPGYPAVVSEDVLAIRGVRYYPTRETRDFLSRIAAERLGKLGVQTPKTKTASTRKRTPPPRLPAPPARDIAAVVDDPAAPLPSVRPKRKSAPARARSSASNRASKPPVKTAAAAPKVTTSKAAPAKVAAAAPPPVVTPVPQPVPVSVRPAAEPAAATQSQSPVVTETVSTSSAEPIVTPAGTTATDTTATQIATATETTATPAPAKPAEPVPPPPRRGLLMPAIVVLVTAGVLWMLFRATN
jgi:hypothetical protein